MEEIIRIYNSVTSEIQEDWLEKDWRSWYDYVVSLNKSKKLVYLTILVDDQVFNGGLHQYYSNRFGIFTLETISALTEIKSVEKSNILADSYSLVKGKLDDNAFRQRLFNYDLPSLFDLDDLYDPLDNLTDSYDSSEEEIDTLLTAYLDNSNV